MVGYPVGGLLEGGFGITTTGAGVGAVGLAVTGLTGLVGSGVVGRGVVGSGVGLFEVVGGFVGLGVGLGVFVGYGVGLFVTVPVPQPSTALPVQVPFNGSLSYGHSVPSKHNHPFSGVLSPLYDD